MAGGSLEPGVEGHTELPEEDRECLIPSHIATRADLYEAEQRNIAVALRRRRPSIDALLDDKYLRDLHRDMFKDVWTWAGRYRRRETNIGIDPTRIAVAVRNLVDDARTWVELGTFEPDELAARFHHRLVQIHPFPNGNGRHGRVAADYLVLSLGAQAFTWGRGLDVSTDELRRTYRHALQRADNGQIDDLLAFCRS
ncbi:MAG TPA: mobile mystery protein B [Acidobacteria bacterium]|nr:mobile mystery protein B [Acidobacteriota bacterium]